MNIFNPSPRLINILEIYYTIFLISGTGFIIASRKYRHIRSLWQRLLLVFSISLIYHAILTMGLTNLIILVSVGMLITIVSEWFAMKYRLWGSYQYSKMFTPILPGGMPLPVVIAWGVLILIAYWVALVIYGFIIQLTGSNIPPSSSLLLRLQLSLLTSLVAVGGDLVLDPVMVKHGHWKWDKGGRWYGIPLSNFFGWFVTCQVSFGLIFILIDPLAALRTPFFSSVVQWLFVGIYLAVMADITLDAAKMKLKGPAVLGLITIIIIGTMLSLLII